MAAQNAAAKQILTQKSKLQRINLLMEIKLNDFRMEYSDQGIGMPILLIHGYPLNRMLWEPQIQDLQGEARILAPDLRGFGGSDPIQGAYSMDLLAQDCFDFLNNIGAKQPVVIGGLSMGGYIAFAFYRLFPERVAALLLAATRAAPDSEEAKAGRNKSIELALERGATAIAEAMLPKMMSPKTYAQQPKLVDVVRKIMESASVEGIVGALKGMQTRPDSTPTLALIDKPTLVLHGADDQLIPLKEAQGMQAAIKNSRMEVLPDAGHLLNLEQPELFNRAVARFMNSL
jgi:pimeloyl-ACP methyl ester carboxylesterase